MPKPNSLLKGFEKAVATAKSTAKRQVIFDEATTGLALIVTPKGKKSFSIVARDPSNKQIWKRIGDPALMSVGEARVLAAEAVARVKAGKKPLRKPEPPKAAPDTFRTVAERFIARWVDKGGKKQDGVPQRGKREIERQLNAYIYPRWGSEPFLSIRRGEVTALMDDMVDNNGAVQADRVLATLNKMFNWYRQYDEHYVNPIIPEMKRSGSIAGRARERILADDEIRAIWAACGEIGTYGAMVQIGLLTGARREKVSTMRWQDLEDGVWTIPVVPREKPHAGQLRLSKLAKGIIEAQPKQKENPFIFAGRGTKAYNSHSAGKKQLDAKVPTEQWQFHDLRRTAKSLMARAGVRSDISERVLGHKIGGVEGVYDRYDYEKEKAEALQALADLVARIIDPPGDNVVRLDATKKTAAIGAA